jgi:acyl transferase domain-containing protein
MDPQFRFQLESVYEALENGEFSALSLDHLVDMC